MHDHMRYGKPKPENKLLLHRPDCWDFVGSINPYRTCTCVCWIATQARLLGLRRVNKPVSYVYVYVCVLDSYTGHITGTRRVNKPVSYVYVCVLDSYTGQITGTS
ncbi:hypothetical protein J6590_039448 [Homalodisca vitripennis]|nr:hypothetical protein J6590_039448 [Homalodisca vitripennis]